MNYLDSLNDKQKRAVLQTEGPVLIVAGAGAGKTKTITHRILHLIQTGISPEKILAITFTNKAAKEMRDRVMSLLQVQKTDLENLIPQGDTSGKPFISTFHSLAVFIIKENSELLGLPRHFTIFDTSDSKKALREVLASLGIDPKDHLDKIRHIISREKGRGVTCNEYISNEAYDYTSELIKKVWPKYEEKLKEERALDFDDLLLKSLFLLEKDKEILDKYQKRFFYVHVDEYQDTNKVQNKMIEIICEKHKNLCVVGDTDQNIYSWRGAEIKNMLHFEKAYPEATTIFLEQNYRSTQNILAVANKIIEKNNFRIPKNLFTENPLGEKISLFQALNETDEADFIALKAKELLENGVQSEKIAVLYRANFQSRALEEAMLSYGIPYQMIGTKFFERKEVKDVMSFVRISLNPEGLSDFLRIINIPPRGLGKISIQKILLGKEDELPEKTRLKINNFRKMISEFKEVLLSEILSEALKYIIKKSGLEEMYKTGFSEDTERLENVMELVTFAKEYDIYRMEEGIEKFLTDSSLISDQDEIKEEKGGLKLMTVHASKGLEFDYVFISGLEDDLFPHKKMGKENGEDSEEERRLFYVALTRAKLKIFLTYAQARTIFGSLEFNYPSEFLDDIPEKYLKKEFNVNGREFSRVHKVHLAKIEF